MKFHLCLICSDKGNTIDLQVDYVIVRKYTDREPSVNVGLKEQLIRFLQCR